jgi:hypothetical protein
VIRFGILTLAIATGLLVGLESSAKAMGNGAPDCSTLLPTDCTTDTCYINCAGNTTTELVLRSAVQAANNCSTNPAFTGRFIYFDKYNGQCIVWLKNDVSSVGSPAQAICDGESLPFTYSICLTGHDITISGGRATTFVYQDVGAHPCTSNANSYGPPAFIVAGTDNAVIEVNTMYFPEGIAIRGLHSGANCLPNSHSVRGTVESLYSDRFCDEAVSIGPCADDAVVFDSTFVGHIADPNCPTGCGTDKAVQVVPDNGASHSYAIGQNHFTNCRAPALLYYDGTFSDNDVMGMVGTCGPPYECTHYNNEDMCEAVEFGTGGMQTAERNTIQFCKLGLHLRHSATVEANYNVIKDGFQSAMLLEAAANETPTLKGAWNYIKGAGWSNSTGCARGGVVSEAPDGVVDLGGGDCNGHVVLGGVAAAGANTFCQGASNSLDHANHPDIRNGATSSCSDSKNLCFGGRYNCFDNDVDVAPDGAAHTVTAGHYTNCDCSQ